MREVGDNIAADRGVLRPLLRAWHAIFGVSQRFTRTSPPAAAAAAILIFMGLVAIFANQLAPYELAKHTQPVSYTHLTLPTILLV